MKNNQWWKRGPGLWARFLGIAVCLILAGKRWGSAGTVYGSEVPETLTYEGPVFTDAGEVPRLEETIEKDGKKYRLVSRRVRAASQGGTERNVSAVVPYALEGSQEPPETAWLTLKDPLTGQEYEREVPRLEIIELGDQWSTDFYFQITVSGYDADIFQLGDREIPADADLSSYGADFLAQLGLSEECYQVETVVWNGESYEKDGILCRDARASGKKLVRNVEVRYGGQVKTPEIKGKQYIGIYEEILPETETAEEEVHSMETEKSEETFREETAAKEESRESSGSMLQKLLYWLKTHITVVTIGAGMILLVFSTLVLLWRTRKRKEEKESPDWRPGP